MCDFIDSTVDREEQLTSMAIANRARYVGVSAVECEECGEPIPEGRRAAIPGVKHCVYCAAIMEIKR